MDSKDTMELKYLASYILILIALYFSYRKKLGLEKKILINSIRALLQLLILGYLLVYIFRIHNPLGLSGILLFMILFATVTAQRRVHLKPKGFVTAFFSIALATVIVIATLMLLQFITFKPHEIIPVGGMVLGNALNAYTPR